MVPITSSTSVPMPSEVRALCRCALALVQTADAPPPPEDPAREQFRAALKEAERAIARAISDDWQRSDRKIAEVALASVRNALRSGTRTTTETGK